MVTGKQLLSMLPAYITYWFGLNTRGKCPLRMLNEHSQFNSSLVWIFLFSRRCSGKCQAVKKLKISFNYACQLWLSARERFGVYCYFLLFLKTKQEMLIETFYTAEAQCVWSSSVLFLAKENTVRVSHQSRIRLWINNAEDLLGSWLTEEPFL